MPLDEFALIFSGAVLKVAPAVGDAAAISEEVFVGESALAADTAPPEAALAPEAEAVEPEAPVTVQDSAAEDVPTMLPAVEPAEDALLDQPVVDALTGYHGNEPADTHPFAEETSFVLAAAATVLDDAEMENILGCDIAPRNWNRNRKTPTVDRIDNLFKSAGGG